MFKSLIELRLTRTLGWPVVSDRTKHMDFSDREEVLIRNSPAIVEMRVHGIHFDGDEDSSLIDSTGNRFQCQNQRFPLLDPVCYHSQSSVIREHSITG